MSVLSLGLFTAVGSALMALPARAAGTTTLHFYSVNQTSTATDVTGQPIMDINATLTTGDHADATDLDYVGNHKHHASSFSASGHTACIVTSATTATCSAQLAISGSLLLSHDVAVPFSQTGTTGPTQIDAGTGKYKNARGTVSVTPIANSNNEDVTITLTS